MLDGFTLIEEKGLPVYRGKATHVKHIRTGMDIIYFKPEHNNESYFSYNFYTPPVDDSGLTHALEHLILEGSERFPLQNLMFAYHQKSPGEHNAQTSNTNTSFYGQSYIPTDYFNLLEMYGDSVFFPLLRQESFENEVWNLDVDEKTGKPFINGVVFNEMSVNKYIQARDIFMTEKDAVYKGIENGYLSGGDYLSIPDLTREKLVEYHKKYYVPGNCTLIISSKIPMEEHLKFLEEKLLCRLPSDTVAVVPERELKPFESMMELNVTFPYNGEDLYEVHLCIISKDSDYSRSGMAERDYFFSQLENTFAKKLMYCKIGQVSINEDGNPASKQLDFGLVNVEKENIEEAKRILLDTIEHCLDDGFDYDDFKSFAMYLDNRYKYPSYLSKIKDLQECIISGRNETGDYFEYAAKAETVWNETKEKFLNSDNEYFKGLLKKTILDNTQKYFTIISPDKEYYQKYEQEKQALLERLLSQTSMEEILEKKERRERFISADESAEKAKYLPAVYLDESITYDDPGLAEIEIVEGNHGPVHLFHSVQEVQNYFYFELRFAADNITEEEKKYFQCINTYIKSLGFSGMGLDEISEYMIQSGIYENSGPYFTYSGTENKADKFYQNRYWIGFSMKCSCDNIEKCFEAIKKRIYEINFDDEKQNRLGKENLTHDVNRIDFDSAGDYGSCELEAYHNSFAKYLSCYFGLEELKINKMIANENIDEVAEKIKQLWNKILKSGSVINVYAGPEYIEEVLHQTRKFILDADLYSLQESGIPEYPLENKDKRIRKTIMIPPASGSLRVCFESSVYPSREYVAEDLFITGMEPVVHSYLRKSLGVYTTHISMEMKQNLIVLSTTQDPNPKESLAVVEEEFRHIDEVEFTEAMVKEMIVQKYGEAIGDIVPENKGYSGFIRRLENTYPEQRKQRLDLLLKITPEDMKAAARRIKANAERMKSCIVTSDDSQTDGEILCDMRKL